MSDEIPVTKATTAELAARYRVSEAFVRGHKREFGAEPLNDTPNSALRFDLRTADLWWERRRLKPIGRPPRARRTRTTKASGLSEFT